MGVGTAARVADVVQLFVEQLALVAVAVVPGHVVDVPDDLTPSGERDDRHPSRRWLHREVRQQLPHEIQFAPEVRLADRGRGVDQEYQFQLRNEVFRWKIGF